MTLTLSAPGKTFLVGEYAVLGRGPALVLNTQPRFTLKMQPGQGRVEGIPDGAPAARWIKAREPLLADWDLKFFDPHMGQGGFGSSGAQFLLTHCLTTNLQSSFGSVIHGPRLGDVWNDYQVLSGGSGSGADLLAQSVGGVARVDMERIDAVSLRWPYENLGFGILRTGEKAVTHTHVKNLDPQVISALVAPATKCVESFGHANANQFVGLLQNFVTELREKGLQARTTLTMTQTLEEQKWCRVAKGCGAMGADTIVFLFERDQTSAMEAFVAQQDWILSGQLSQLSDGLQFEWSGHAG